MLKQITTKNLLNSFSFIRCNCSINFKQALPRILRGASLKVLNQSFASPALVSLSSPITQHSSFRGASLKVSNQSFSLSSTTISRPLTIVTATKKALAVLKGNGKVKGVITLTQEDDVQLSLALSFFCFFLPFLSPLNSNLGHSNFHSVSNGLPNMTKPCLKPGWKRVLQNCQRTGEK
ncbi:hypothetical protein AMTRI_Chr04g252370 [Amborella trichopoda]